MIYCIRLIRIIVIPPLYQQTIGIHVPLAHSVPVRSQIRIVKHRIVMDSSIFHDQPVIVADDAAFHHRFHRIQVKFHIQFNIKLVDVQRL